MALALLAIWWVFSAKWQKIATFMAKTHNLAFFPALGLSYALIDLQRQQNPILPSNAMAFVFTALSFWLIFTMLCIRRHKDEFTLFGHDRCAFATWR